jgi:hypothetical protein
MRDAGLPALMADTIVSVFASQRAGSMTRVTDAVRALTGRPPGTFAHFARDHAALFGAGAFEPAETTPAPARGALAT